MIHARHLRNLNRFQAFGIHFGISLLIFVFLAYLVLFHWYPDFFFESDGGWQGMRIIVFVDLVLGPVLTLVVFNPKKPELPRDLSIIGAIQIACLTAGTHVVWNERPIALVYVDETFYSMPTSTLLTVDDIDHLAGSGPKRVAVDLPLDPNQQSALRRQMLQQERPLRTLTELYAPMDNMPAHLRELGIRSQVVALLKGGQGALDRFTQSHGGEPDDFVFFAFGARYGYYFLGVSTDTGATVGMLELPYRVYDEFIYGTDQAKSG